MQNIKKVGLGRLWVHLKSERKDIVMATAYSILNKIFDLAPPLLIGLSVDIVVKKESSILTKYFPVQTVMEQLWLVSILTLVIWVLESFFEFLLKVRWRNLAQKVQHLLRMEAFSHVQNLELAYFEDKSTGNLISIINDDVNQLERFLNNGANSLLQVMTTVIVIGAIFFSISPLVATFSFLPIPLILWGSFYFQKKIEPLYGDVRKEVGILSSILTNNLSGIATVKSYVAEKFEIERLRDQSHNYAVANAKAITVSSSYSPLIRMVVLCGFIATTLLGGWLVEKGTLEVGSYSVLIFMTQRLLWPLTSLAETFDLFQRSMASTRRIFSLIDTPLRVVSGKKSISLRSDETIIELKDLSFSYNEGPRIIKNLDLTINPKETVAFVGATGSGKSTLTKLLLRFYDPEKGSITIGGEEIKTLELGSLRNLFSYVGQDTYLFHGTVRENILYGKPSASEEEMIEAAKHAYIHDFIVSLPKGYDTLVGERGQKLSGGQRQRISLARAILKDAPIFIFDEATSAIDNETEAAIARSLADITKNRTTIMIAHRLSTVLGADRIFVLKEGIIIESGAHSDLMERKGAYYDLWNVKGDPIVLN
ncbi:ABC transporter transmembrane region [Bacteriovorax sp. BSW11_IV]|uniref:ABC transporter ATP-binding protein n=1 Tax=Bacteriovorax sp. BSW11_IV TaxID=1353529 RepID=UPI00038A3957|nr:ABC transporter ATP-binding protein [Bacteriovorax sp. BSW11_IV]EQC47782.1 ABC transporter transmembrane region [Bacteriovorax sp. BSW11_IV]